MLARCLSLLLGAACSSGCGVEGRPHTEGTSVTSLTESDTAVTDGDGVVTIALNDAPIVDAIAIDTTPLTPGQAVRLEVVAHDVDGDEVATFAWSTTCEGAFDDARVAAPRFTPGSGTRPCVFAVRLTDARGGTGSGELHVDASSR